MLTRTWPWQNTEDEILKAAVSKYGKNQWARISSLVKSSDIQPFVATKLTLLVLAAAHTQDAKTMQSPLVRMA